MNLLSAKWLGPTANYLVSSRPGQSDRETRGTKTTGALSKRSAYLMQVQTTGKPALLDWVIATACSNGGQAAPKAPTFWHRQELPRMDRGPYKVLWYRWSGRRPPGRSPWRAFGPKPFSWDCTHLRSSSIQWCPFVAVSVLYQVDVVCFYQLPELLLTLPVLTWVRSMVRTMNLNNMLALQP